MHPGLAATSARTRSAEPHNGTIAGSGAMRHDGDRVTTTSTTLAKLSRTAQSTRKAFRLSGVHAPQTSDCSGCNKAGRRRRRLTVAAALERLTDVPRNVRSCR